ncbi:MAG: hypothetical protein JO132_11850 [Streptosporangiaceae bacterium]|nr:hypothetical protein [Streptosporangiaceae bacterium]
MMQGSPVPEGLRPGQLILRTEGACGFDPQHLLAVFGRQRHRFAAVLAGFAPGVTIARFLATTHDLLAVARGRLARGHHFDVWLPYGPMDWTMLVLHAFWDSWLHERDVLLAMGREHPTDSDATGYAAAYGLFIAAGVASMFGDQVHQQLMLGGDGGGVFELTAHGAVTLSVTPATTGGPPAAEVTDAIAGRASIPAVLGDLPADMRAALSRMADFFNTPVPHSPA